VARLGGFRFLSTLVVALFAAAASYYATWRFKKGDVIRDNAFRAADLVDEASRVAGHPTRYEEEAGGLSGTLRLLWEGRVRAEPSCSSTTRSQPWRRGDPAGVAVAGESSGFRSTMRLPALPRFISPHALGAGGRRFESARPDSLYDFEPFRKLAALSGIFLLYRPLKVQF
jgi:hypothetical protein